ncbi:hypothetical protein JCM10449v2_005754 [Rhodotorula kratochvilovae]
MTSETTLHALERLSLADEQPKPSDMRLPVELWVKILKDELLAYIDLKHVSMTCKWFNDVLEDPCFDECYFRTPPSSCRLRDGAPAAAHPLLGHTLWLPSDTRHVVRASKQWKGWHWIPRAESDLASSDWKAVNKLPMFHEFATRPSTTRVWVRRRDETIPGAEVYRAGGVRVADIVEDVVEAPRVVTVAQVVNHTLADLQAYFAQLAVPSARDAAALVLMHELAAPAPPRTSIDRRMLFFALPGRVGLRRPEA